MTPTLTPSKEHLEKADALVDAWQRRWPAEGVVRVTFSPRHDLVRSFAHALAEAEEKGRKERPSLDAHVRVCEERDRLQRENGWLREGLCKIRLINPSAYKVAEVAIEWACEALAAADAIRIRQYWDCASKPGVSNDFSVCATIAETPTGFYWLHVWRQKVAFPQPQVFSCGCKRLSEVE